MSLRLALILLIVGGAGAQDPDPAWQRVGALPEGAALRVHLRNRDVVSGRLVRWSPAELALGQSTIPKPEITKVSRRSRLRGALIGFAVGFAIAAPIGAYAGPYLADYGNPGTGVRLRHAGGWGIFFGGIGAGLGALAGAHPTVYRAR
jgi:hypothetical protein